jgi:hypothetical protein
MVGRIVGGRGLWRELTGELKEFEFERDLLLSVVFEGFESNDISPDWLGN